MQANISSMLAGPLSLERESLPTNGGVHIMNVKGIRNNRRSLGRASDKGTSKQNINGSFIVTNNQNMLGLALRENRKLDERRAKN